MEDFLKKVGATVALVSLVAWTAAVAAAVIHSFKHGPDPEFLTSAGMTYFMPGLTALVGGVVAAGFGLSNSNEPNAHLHALANTITGEDTNAANQALAWRRHTSLSTCSSD